MSRMFYSDDERDQQDRAVLYGKIKDLEALVDKLRGAIGHFAECPCCEQRTECDEECTFGEDCPDDYEQMQYFRSLLYEVLRGDQK